MGTVWRVLAFLAGENVRDGFAVQKAIFRLLGLSWWKQSIYTRLYTVAVLLIVGIHLFSIHRYTYSASVETDEDFKIVVLSLVLTIVMSSGSVKHVLTFFVQKRLAKLIDYMETEIPVDDPLPGFKLTAQFAGQVSVTASSYSFSGLLFKDNLAKGLIWPCEFPWDYTTPIGQAVAIMWQMVCAWFCFMQNIGLDTVPVVTVHKLIVHIKRMKENLAKVGMKPEQDFKLISQAVDTHNKILVAVELMNSAYAFLLLYQVVYMVIHGCVIIFCIATLDAGLYVWRCLVPMLISAYFELLVFCQTGQLLTSQMEELHFNCFDNYWYNSSQENKKSILIFMTGAQREVKFESYGITAALYPTYLTSAQESCSYYLVLRTIQANMAAS